MLSALQEHPAVFLLAVTLLGLVIGSFLNVVIHRLPLMMQRAWTAECREFLAGEDNAQDNAVSTAPFNLIVPRSQCPCCGHKISALENIPVVSYIALRGRCAQCRAPISLQYPTVELLAALLSLTVAWWFGYGLETAATLIFTWALIALSGIDFHTKLLPDSIVLPLLWLGLLANTNGMFTDLQSAVLGAVFGYLSLWAVYHAFKLLTGKEGMGHGDFKLLAMLGAWAGWQALPLIILLSSLVGAVVGVALICIQGRERSNPIPFGPFLATAGWVALPWGAQINDWYLRQML